jgi:uncharacterized protein (TIGR00288 family)
MTQERVMLLIDADNVSVDVMEQAVKLLMNQHGAVHVRRAYCTAESALKHQAIFKRLSIKPMVNLAAGKNSTDIALAVDAIDLVLAERPDVVVICSSDSDFAPLVARLREKGCVVRGIGQEGKTGDETQDAYDDYTVLAHRKVAGAVAVSASSGGASRRGGGRAAGGRRSATPAAKAAQGDAPAAPPPGRAARTQGSARGGRGGQRPAKAAPLRDEASALDQAENEAAAEASLATLRQATERAVAQQQAADAAARAAADAAVDTAADGARDAEDAVPAPAARKPSRKTAARKTAKAPKAPAGAAGDAGDAPAKPARKAAAKKSAQPAATQPAAAAPAPAAPAATAAAAAAATAAAVAALPDKVLEILASLPELARGETVELRLASMRLRDAGLLSKSGSSTKLLGQFGDRFELLPPGQPNHVRLRGGKLV